MSNEEIACESSPDIARRDLIASLALIGLIIALALGRLALEGNWPKVLRVFLAFSVYSTFLLSSGLWLLRPKIADFAPHFWIFALAAAAAEISSGWLRPDWKPIDALTLPLAAALLIGGIHWLTLRLWRPLRNRIHSRHWNVERQ